MYLKVPRMFSIWVIIGSCITLNSVWNFNNKCYSSEFKINDAWNGVLQLASRLLQACNTWQWDVVVLNNMN